MFYYIYNSGFGHIVFSGDNRQAERHKRARRIRESTLMIFSALGGSAVMYLSMNAFHHKTQKNKFVFGIPLIFAVQCIIIALAYKYGLG